MTYKLIKKIIENGSYERSSMLSKLDVFLLGERITEAQYQEIVAMMMM